jgi:hypothetical protein
MDTGYRKQNIIEYWDDFITTYTPKKVTRKEIEIALVKQGEKAETNYYKGLIIGVLLGGAISCLIYLVK